MGDVHSHGICYLDEQERATMQRASAQRSFPTSGGRVATHQLSKTRSSFRELGKECRLSVRKQPPLPSDVGEGRNALVSHTIPIQPGRAIA